MKQFVLPSMICLMMLPNMSVAEEETSPPVVLSGGIICDSLDETISFLEKNPAPSCRKLYRPAVGTVTFVVEYEADELIFNLVRYEFLQPLGFPAIQYGWFGSPIPSTNTADDPT